MTLDIKSLPHDKPLLLMDVDGVLNTLCRNPSRKIYDVFTVHGMYSIALRWELMEWLKRLGEHYHLVWATMWDDDANTELAPQLGLPELPVIPCADKQFTPARWKDRPVHTKVPCIQEKVGDRPFAWIDDTIGANDQAWAQARENETAPTYLLWIDPRMGLLEHHVNKLVGWAQKLGR